MDGNVEPAPEAGMPVPAVLDGPVAGKASTGTVDGGTSERKDSRHESANASAQSSASSSSSRLSIRIPRKAVSGEDSGCASVASSTCAVSEEANASHPANGAASSRDTEADGNPNEGRGAEMGEEGPSGENSDKDNDRKRSKGSKIKTIHGRKRRGQQDSDESAYSESDGEDDDEDTESDEAYSEENDDEYDDQEDNEDWNSYPRKHTKKVSSNFRSYAPPMSIPFQYSTMSFGPTQPLPSNMANIPMFAKLAQSHQAVRSPAPVHPGTFGVGLAHGTGQIPAETKVDPGVENPGLASAQLQELAKSAVNSLANVMQDGKKLQVILPRNAEAAANVRPSAELKETLTSMLASPQWRAALLAKLQMNRAISADQAAKLGLRPAAPAGALPQVPIAPMGMPYMMRPMMMPMSSYQYRPKPPKKKTTPSSASSASQLVDDIPIASRRERRTPKKQVDYSLFFKKDADEDDEEEEGDGEENIHEHGEDDDDEQRHSEEQGEGRSRYGQGRKSRRAIKTSGSKDHFNPGSRLAKRQSSSKQELHNDEQYEDLEDEDLMIHSSGASDDTGVEKILSHRVFEGKSQFLVKFRNLSYLHVDWISEEDMLEENNGASRIKRFLSKPLSVRHYSDKHPFNPEYIQIDRIVHGWEHPDENDHSITTASYLVKWIGLPYSEAIWEKKSTILGLIDGLEKLAEYERRPTLEERKTKTAPVGYRPGKNDFENMTESPIYKGGNTLRPYQLEGVNWLIYCWVNRQSCIIADEMGLGKTVQSVAFLNLIYNTYNVRGPFLVVAPLSTIPHWEREFEAWTDLNCIVYHGNIPSRDLMCEYEFFYRDGQERPIPNFYKFDVMITTYEMALAGFEHLQPILWRAAVFDEAHRLKNRASKASETLKALQIEHKVLLTGTPLQNNIEELWSLLNFLQPHRFYSESQFVAEYGNLKRSEDVIKIQELLKPLMLRRLKEDVEKSIPVKEETVIEVELTSVQKRYYRAILERNFAFLTKGCRGANSPNLINAMMELRKCCIHPYLIKGAEERILQECSAISGEEQMSCMVQASGKLVLVDKLLKKLRENGHRVLIFSQMTRCLDLLSDYLKWREYPFERIDGAIKGEARQAAIDHFCHPESDSFVFLLCTRAGGVGINLTAADTVVIFDSDWNPQNDIQAQARCHRIGQTKSVKVYRLLTRNTYEREMFDKAGMKLGLDRAVLRKILPNETLEGASHSPQLSKKEVETLLKKGAYGLLMENDEDSIRFCEEDIDQILARRSTVIRHNGGDEQAAEGSIFSKASFAATADDMDIEIDDPNFWELWARRLDLDPHQLLSSSGVVVDEPRIKRQARRLKAADLDLREFEMELLAAAEQVMSTDTVPGKEQLWTDCERSKFVYQLLLFGIHRYEDILPAFSGRSKNDLIACSRSIIKVCLEATEGSEDARLKEDSEKLLLAHLDFDRSAVDSEIVDEATGKIDLAAAEMQNEEPVEATAPMTREFTKSDIPFSGASRRQIIEFRSFVRGMPANLNENLQKHAKAILLRLQLLDFIRQLVEGHATVAKQVNNKMGGSGEEPNGGEVEYQLPVPNIVGSAPTLGWGKTEDEALVVGVYKNGFGQYTKISADSSLAFSKKTWQNASKCLERTGTSSAQEQTQEAAHEQNPEETAVEGALIWPSQEELDGRLKKVVLAMEKRTQAAAKLAIQAVSTAKEGSRRRVNVYEDDDEMYEEEYVDDGRRKVRSREPAPKTPAVLSMRWSKRDRGEFQRVVMAYGLPVEKTLGHRDWSRFKELGVFANSVVRAGDRAFDEYCELFIKGCKAVAEKRPSKKKETEYVEEDEDAADDWVGEGDGVQGDKKGSVALPVIPAERAKRVLAKIELYNKLRLQVLTLSDLESYFEKSRRTSGLPSWWETPKFDVALLKAAAKYGTGRWDLAIMDETLPFHEVYKSCDPGAFERNTVASELSETLQKKKKKKVEARGTPAGGQVDLQKMDWPAETIIARRVESLIDMALNEERRRAKSAEGEAPEAGVSPRSTGKRRRSVKLNVRELPAEQAQGAIEEESKTESPKKRHRRAANPKQRSLLDFGVRVAVDTAEEKDGEQVPGEGGIAACDKN